MKKILLSLTIALSFSMFSNAQSNLKGAESFSVTIPESFRRTIGTNDLATVQWEHKEKEIYGYVLFENRDELQLVEISTDLKEFADQALNDFNMLTKYKLVNAKKFKTASGFETEQREFTYYDEENDINFHMMLNIFKTENFMYKMLNYGTKESFKDSKKDIEYIINNIKLP